MSQLKINEASLYDLGFAMKVKAGTIESDIMQVSKELWLQIAERLMEQTKNKK